MKKDDVTGIGDDVELERYRKSPCGQFFVSEDQYATLTKKSYTPENYPIPKEALNRIYASHAPLAEAMTTLEEYAKLLRQCAIIVESQARQDWGQQKLLAGFKPCEPDSAAIQLWETLREKGFSVWK